MMPFTTDSSKVTGTKWYKLHAVKHTHCVYNDKCPRKVSKEEVVARKLEEWLTEAMLQEG